MHLNDFNFDLPSELIASHPAAVRTACRLLRLDGGSGKIYHEVFSDLLQLLQPGDLLVLNDTQVIPARLFGHKASGGRIELLVERLLTEQQLLVQLRASKTPKIGSQLTLEAPPGHEPVHAIVIARQGALFRLQLQDSRPLLTILHTIGHIPLPPYLQRPETEADREQYQTVYARVPGAVAAPTAGLHFDRPLLAALQAKGVLITTITLHVGAGTFQPVRAEQIQNHVMHAEAVTISATAVEAILACRARGRRVVAVGTTAVRALESAAAAALHRGEPPLTPFDGETRLFIYPGYPFRIVDAMITNFHLPRSTLLMLVCAFGGYQAILLAYQSAIEQRYRFFSYGDAMFLTRYR
jgi:S-adenosylmethionine:tRNA ribosyltransferase-isomerase